MLRAREARRAIQRRLLSHHALPLISLTLNIAGPRKRTALSEFAFDHAARMVLDVFGPPAQYEQVREDTGCEAFFVYDGNPLE